MEPTNRIRVVIESPFTGDVTLHCYYADCLMLDSMNRNEAPFLGHLLYPRVLNDNLAIDRAAGIECHLAWLLSVQHIIIGMDLGEPTGGMQAAIDLADKHNIQVKPRWLGNDWQTRFILKRTEGFK